MWSPTHTQVTVLKAKNVLTKGKNGTNNCFVTISLGKEKYQTSIKEKAETNVDWHEECELTIPNQGNRAELVLTCLHHNNLGLDEFLGQVTLPLSEMDVYERPRAKWYKLQSKPGKEKKKERGELEIRVAFTVKAGSLTDLSKKEKHKSSIGQIASNVGGSLLSLGTLEKRKGIKKFAKSLGSKVHISGKSKKDKNQLDEESFNESFSSIGTAKSPKFSRQTFDDADPGVISENDDEFALDNLSHKSSGNSLNIKSSTTIFHPTNTQFSTLEEENLTGDSSLPPPKPLRNSQIPSSPVTPTIAAAAPTATTGSVVAAPAATTTTTTITATSQPKLDEWEAKLYGGGKQQLGSADSLKRRSWENNRVPLNLNGDRDATDQFLSQEKISSTSNIPASITAPSTPTLNDKLNGSSNGAKDTNDVPATNRSHTDRIEKPRTLPRSLTLESVIEKDDKVEKSEKNIFAKKLKYFGRKDKSAGDHHEKHGLPRQYEERIIIGHENDVKVGKTVELSQEVVKKYEGKSREEIMKIAHNLENEVRSEKMKIKELEDYLDNLLLRVMETHPRILQNPYVRNGQNKSG